MYIKKNTPLLHKRHSLNLHRGTSVLEKWVKRSTRRWCLCDTRHCRKD